MIKLDTTYFQKLYNYNPDPEQIKYVLTELKKEIDSGEVGYYHLPKYMRPVLKEIRHYVKSLSKDIDTFLLIGIGGSALGPQTIDQALRTHKTKKNFICLDNTDPDLVTDILNSMDPKKTLVNVVSKSGGTLETIANFSIVDEHYKDALGEIRFKNYVFTTDPVKSKLKDFGEKMGVKCFYIPSNVGGRFSVLSPVGLLMAEFVGYNVDLLLDGAKEIVDSTFNTNINENPVLEYGLIKYHAYKNEHKTVSVMMPYSSKLSNFSAWYKQLWGESLGKRFDKLGKEILAGQTPVQAVGSIDQHSILQYLIEGPKTNIVTFIKVVSRLKQDIPRFELLDRRFKNIDLGEVNNSQLEATSEALCSEGHPSLLLELDRIDEKSLAYLFTFFEIATSIFGLLLNVNTYDQPGVELGKKIISEKYELKN